jgi:hypothetical protein
LTFEIKNELKEYVREMEIKEMTRVLIKCYMIAEAMGDEVVGMV